MKRVFAVSVLVASSTALIPIKAKADYEISGTSGSIFKVFDESIQKVSNPKEYVIFYYRWSGVDDYGKSSADLSQVLFNCKTKYESSRASERYEFPAQKWTPTDSIARSMGDYACEFVEKQRQNSKSQKK